MRKAIKKERTLEEVYNLAKSLKERERLRLISKIADELVDRKTIHKKRKPITEYKICGIWKDRKDMQDSVFWVSKLRREEERRSYHE